jgi:DNA polymerase III delta subunit
MSSYNQWSKAFASKGPARITWVCGTERVLAAEVVSATFLAVHSKEGEEWTAGRHREKDIWASVLAISFAEKRFVLVRDAWKLKDWEKLRIWIDQKHEFRDCYLVFASYEQDFPRDSDGKLAEPCTWLRDSTVGQIVRCTPLDPVEAAAWACRQMPGLSAVQARHLLERASGSLAEVRTVLAKAKLFGGQVSDQALDLLCSELPGDFVDKLIRRDRKAAMLAAESLGSDGLGYSIGLLASRLNILAALHRAARDNVSRREVIVQWGVPAFLAQKYAGIAREYGEARVSRCWEALAAVEDAYKSGSADGAAEVLVTAWWG